MKSRKKNKFQELTVYNPSESNSVIRNFSESILRRRLSLNPVFHKSAQFIKSCNNLFRKPSQHFGDADTYFRQSLRNYDAFDLWRSVHLDFNYKSLNKYNSSNRELLPSSNLRDRKWERSYSVEKYLQQNKTRSKSTMETPLPEDDQPSEEQSAEAPTPGEGETPAAEETPAGDTPAPTTTDEPPTTDDENNMNDVDEMVRQASRELEQVAQESKQTMEALEEGDTAPTTPGGDENINKDIDPDILRELEDAEAQAKETAKTIYELKTRVGELLKKEKMTEEEAKELEQKNKELKNQMVLFEEKTKRIQYLINKTSLLVDGMPRSYPQRKHNEDVLPKVLVCGTTEHNVPKIIVCDGKAKSKTTDTERKCRGPCNRSPAFASEVPQFARRLNESYVMQEKLAAENADLEGMRYKLQEDLLSKDKAVESLQRKLQNLQNEMKVMCKENCLLKDKVENLKIGTMKTGKPCGPEKGICPAMISNRLQEYSENTYQLEKQLEEMELDVKEMAVELEAVQKEREHLEHHRKLLTVAPMPAPPPQPPCMMPPFPFLPPPCFAPPCSMPSPPQQQAALRCPSGMSDQHFRELKEKYDRLQDDFKGKLTEVASLRADNERMKTLAKEAEEFRKTAEEKMKECDRLMKSLKLENNKYLGSKEQLLEQEQQLVVAKQRFREAQDELEEVRALIEEQKSQMDDYRNKYLQAQQQVEEQKRQIDMMEMENNRVSEQVNLEIQRVKNQFTEKLQELTPLPDILKATQLKLQDAQKMHMLAERNNEALTKELQMYRDKAAAIAYQMEQVKSDQALGDDEKKNLGQQLLDLQEKCDELRNDNVKLQAECSRFEELANKNGKKAEELLHEIAQLMAQLESVREESARQVARTKERCETVRRSMQNQISDLEKQLALSRAQAKAAQKDRDDIRQKMQAQINNLNENFEDAQMRIRNLQGHVNYLKTSYPNVFNTGDGPHSKAIEDPDPCNCN